MISKTLVKLVDEAVLPAVVLVAAKMLSAVVVTEVLGLKWNWQNFGMVYYSTGDFLKANSYSALVMFAVILVFTLWVIFKSHVLHDTHVAPVTAVKAVSFNLTHLIQGSFELYSQATVWLSYSWLTAVLLGVLALSNLIYPWVFFLALVLSIITTVLMIMDVEREVTLHEEDLLEIDKTYV